LFDAIQPHELVLNRPALYVHFSQAQSSGPSLC